MMSTKKPVLSIGIIFKNEIRCLERCLKSLQPLREAVPCELVMADTGSTDGSREIAAKYADILFDFPWIDDFAAARNAVLDRCSGDWCLSIDADEWLDGEFSQLTDFLSTPHKWPKYNLAAVTVRNYTSKALEEGQYSDFLAARMARMDTGARYQGAIHERWTVSGGTLGMDKAILHHDGYVGLHDSEKGKAKMARNMALLEEKLAKDPDNLMTLMQCVESTTGAEQENYLHRAVAAVLDKRPGWKELGASILRYDVDEANKRKLPELADRIERAKELFPDSPFVTIDIAFVEFYNLAEHQKAYAQAIPVGEGYLAALADYRTGGRAMAATIYNTLDLAAPAQEHVARILLANAYFEEKQYEKAQGMLRTLDGSSLSRDCVRNYVGVLLNLHAQGGLDMSEDLARFWVQTVKPTPTPERARERRDVLITSAARVFPLAYREGEQALGYRHAYTCFLGLEGETGFGVAAQVLETEDAAEMARAMAALTDWTEFPIHALIHALQHGMAFPLPDKPLNMEEMDALAGRLALVEDRIFPLAVESVGASSPQEVCWARSLLLAAVRRFGWKGTELDEVQGMMLARAFASVEGKFLRLCYAPGALGPENIFLLPPLHRFGYYCAQAFEALDTGDAAGYVRLLRKGLAACEGVKDMVEFLMDHTPQIQDSSTELKALAEQIRTVLSRFSPDDPAVAALKQSEAYQRVAYLIEGIAPPIEGRLLQ